MSIARTVSAAAKLRLLVAQCINYERPTPNIARVRVKWLKLDENLNMYFPEFDYYFAHDSRQICKDGDIVLVKEVAEKSVKDVLYTVLKVVYPYGDITDPITGKKCVGNFFREDEDMINEMYGGHHNYRYQEAPPRGSELGRRDHSHRIGYTKYHEFEPGHPLYNDPAAT